MDVTIRCVCPPKADGEPRHEADTVTLRDTLGFVATQTARNAVHLARADARAEEIDLDPAYALALLDEQYVYVGVESWTLVDEKGKPLPVSRGTIADRLMSDDNADAGIEVSDKAGTLYARKVMLPLLQTASSSSQPTPTASTSRTRGSGKVRPIRSSRSSTSTTRTDGTGTTSLPHDGDSSSSRNSASVA